MRRGRNSRGKSNKIRQKHRKRKKSFKSLDGRGSVQGKRIMNKTRNDESFI